MLLLKRLITVLGALLCAVLVLPAASSSGPTVEEYLAVVGSEAKAIPYGQLRIDGKRVICGKRPTVIDPTLDDYGAAYPTFIILNPKKLEGLPTAVKLWIYSHECAHQFRGPDEVAADCFAVQRGRRQGWLKPEGLAKVCKFIMPARGSSTHFSGVQRCEKMQQCYGEKYIY